MNLQGQDWGEVVIRKKKPTAAQSQTEASVNAARRSAAEVDTLKKYSAGSNKTTGTGKDAAKLDRETEETHHERVPSELKKRISQARLDKKLTQAQLAQQINEKPSVINEYESGKAIPNPQVLSKMSRALGVQLSAKVGKKKTQE
ncbi:multiprotein-bridging factor 1 [Trebouxia sp. C0010 RCD-2024]